MNVLANFFFLNFFIKTTGKMDLGQLRKSGLVAGLNFIDNEPDINKSIDFFSYEHFYVIYCKFWEVDTDHDLIISAEDLMVCNWYGRLTQMANSMYRGILEAHQQGGWQKELHLPPYSQETQTWQGF
jgi:hypothetical protein